MTDEKKAIEAVREFGDYLTKLVADIKSGEAPPLTASVIKQLEDVFREGGQQ